MIETFRRFIPWIAAAIMALVIIIGLMTIGGPAKARAEKNDAQRLRALADTAKTVACYRLNKKELPQNLSDVAEAVENTGSEISKSKHCNHLKYKTDPFSDQPFELTAIDDERFKLCAVFERPSGAQSNVSQYGGTIIDYNSRDILKDTDERRPEGGRYCYESTDYLANWSEN